MSLRINGVANEKGGLQMNFPTADLSRVRARARMVERLRTQGIRDEKVLAAMGTIPRHLFVEEGLAYGAYDDNALPIGLQQTISQPFVVARMIETLHAGRELGRTLEIGTGCGYQAAVLSQMTDEVYSIERLRALLDRARENLRTLRLPNLRLKCGDGTLGLPEVAPFDTIIVAAAGLGVPPALKEQLAAGGKLLIPVGGQEQRLLLIERRGSVLRESWCEAVRFVPLRTGME
jgi:protein-L-isoaspartate(D-aspartate) O-methyltransferase